MTKETLQKITHLLGMTYQELADNSGYSFAAIDSYMKGVRKPSSKIELFLQQELKRRKDEEAIIFVLSALTKS